MKKLLLVPLAFLPGLAFAQVKISALPAASAQTGVEILPEVQSATTKGATVNQIQTYIFGDVSSDCTATSGGALTCTKTNGTAFGIWATGTHVCADLTNAGNGCSGTLPVGGNPSANVGTSATNGSSANFMRADAAPAIDQTMSPTMTGVWTFSPTASATPSATTWQGAASGSGTNVAGAAHTIEAGAGTGTGAGGLFTIDAAKPASGSGSSTNAYQHIISVTETANTGNNADEIGMCGNPYSSGTYGCWRFYFGQNSSSTYLMVLGENGGGTPRLALSPNGMTQPSGQYYSWGTVGSVSAGTQSPDTYLTRHAAANVQLGAADAAAPVAQTFSVQSVVAGTSNTAGANLTVNGSASTGSGKGGSIILQTSLATAAATTQNSYQTVLTLDGNQHVSSGGGAPGVSSCGGGSPSVSGTDMDGVITIGTTATACTLTFKIAYAAAPHCVVQDISTVAHLTSYTVGTGAIVLTMTSNSGDLVHYICFGA